MLCEKCNVNEATVHIVKVVNGDKQEMRLCESCAKDISDIPISSLDGVSEFSFNNILSGLMDYINKASQNPQPQELKCNNCGMTYRRFRKIGLLGCSECYEVFSKTLNPIIKRVQGDVEHVGKVPLRISKGYIEKKKIIKLKEELQQAILAEEYEKAAMLRDEIRALQQKLEE